ncbi:hypothetical protein [Catellatospora vulcania]|uniref:hypothetical protein n=1 Tax=Catellatospora vulcania TaxID=1460450 RepID=UPI0012D3E9DD|nr:hypothetical protein [Catellatospora vulcania]
MGEPYVHVNYDFGAADQLASALTAAANDTHALIEQRKAARTSLLGAEPGLAWDGRHRRDFDRDFTSQQRKLAALEDDLRDALKVLHRISQQAHDVNKRHR